MCARTHAAKNLPALIGAGACLWAAPCVPCYPKCANNCIVSLGSGAMEMRKAEYLGRSTREHTEKKGSQQKKKAHTSMKIDASSSRDRNMALAAKFGIKDALQVLYSCTCMCVSIVFLYCVCVFCSLFVLLPHLACSSRSVYNGVLQVSRSVTSECERLKTAESQMLNNQDDERNLQTGGEKLSSGQIGPFDPGEALNSPGRKLVVIENGSEDGGVKDGAVGEAAPAEEEDGEFHATPFVEELVDNCVQQCGIRELKRLEGTGTEVRIERVPFEAKKQKGMGQKFSTISTLLRLTGLVGRADGQFS